MPTIEEAIRNSESGFKDRPKGEMEKMVLDLIVEVFGDKIDELVSDAAEEHVSKFLKVLRGPQGERGMMGLQGEQGFEGTVGGRGPQGEIGERGERGPTGPEGKQGKQGVPGLSGKDGKSGKDGTELSAEEIKNKLQFLKGEARLDASAIKNLPKERGGMMHGGGAALTYNEVPSGAVDGANTTFTLANLPKSGSVMLFVNGLLQRSGTGNDFTISGRTITMVTAPPTNSNVLATYAR